MKELMHQLTDINTNKIHNLSIKNNTIISESGKINKLKSSEKEFPNNEDAIKYFYKKEYELLRKGFVLKNSEAKIGQPILHCFIGKGFTGCLSIINLGEATAIYKFGDYKNDALVLIDKTSKLIETIKLPKPLPWQIAYHKKQQFLLLDIDHFAYIYSLKTKEFTQLTFDFDQPGSFISLSENRIAYGSHPMIYVKDIVSNSIIFERKYDAELFSGHSLQFAGSISKDGSLLALCTHSGKIIFINLNTGIETVVRGNFEMVRQMEFINDDQMLVLKEKYGSWGMRYFDMSTHKEIEIPTLRISDDDSYLGNLVDSYCFNDDYSKLVLTQRRIAYVFDFKTKKILHSYQIEHIADQCNVTFIGDQLGVRTDFGCFSIYKI